MARRTHYETLGLRPNATDAEIRSAYRKIALRHHPDRSTDPASPGIFMKATEAYEVLNDPQAKRDYDRSLESEALREAERQKEEQRKRETATRVQQARETSTAPRSPKTRGGSGTASRTVSVGTQLTRLSMLFSRGLHAEAEKLAQDIIAVDPRQPLPYSILGDLARGRGKLDEAARQYSLAIQMDPRNPMYLRRYEEVLSMVSTSSKEGQSVGGISAEDRPILGLLMLVLVLLFCAVFVAMSTERPGGLAAFGPLHTWTIGLLVMLFVCGVAVGACLSMGGLLDRLEAFSQGRLAPTVALGLVSLVSFPAAAAIYGVLGAVQRAFNVTTTRMMTGVGATVVVLALAATLSQAHTDLVSVLAFGGNLAYIGSLCGWAVADSLRR